MPAPRAHLTHYHGVLAPSSALRARLVPELQRLERIIAERIGCSLERAGLITRDLENPYLDFDPSEEAPIHALIGHSINLSHRHRPRGRIGVGYSS